MHLRMKAWVMALLLVGCDSSTSPPGPVPDAGTQMDAGVTDDAGIPDDAGTADSGVPEGAPCEKSQGVCAGAKRAWVDGAYEPVCTARSYGADYEATETRCDGLDNDCDGVADPATWSEVAPLKWAPYHEMVDSLRVEGGFLMVIRDSSEGIQVLRFDESMTLQGSHLIPLPPSFSLVTQAQLVRTSHGLALYFTAQHADSVTRGHLVQLDEQGTPIGSPEGVVLFEGPNTLISVRVAPSVDGERIAVVWVPNIWDSREVRGMTVDANGQALTQPQSLLQSDGDHLSSPEVLGLGSGGFLVTAIEGGDASLYGWRVRLRRFDGELSPDGGPRVLPVAYGAIPKLLLQAPAQEGGVGEPMMLYRESEGFLPRIHQVTSLFGPTMSETLTPTAWGVARELGATMTSRGLQLAWLTMNYGIEPGLASSPGLPGRLWGLSPSGVVTEWTPNSAPMSMDRQGEWVRLHELPGHWMGALLMTATYDPPSYTLHSLRYCAP